MKKDGISTRCTSVITGNESKLCRPSFFVIEIGKLQATTA